MEHEGLEGAGEEGFGGRGRGRGRGRGNGREGEGEGQECCVELAGFRVGLVRVREFGGSFGVVQRQRWVGVVD